MTSIPSSHSTQSIYRRIAAESRPFRLHLLLLTLIEFLGMPLALLTPLPLKIVVDNWLGSRPLPWYVSRFLPHSISTNSPAILNLAALLLIAATLATLVQRTASSLLSTYVGEKLTLRFRTRLFGHVQRLSIAYHDSKGSSDTTYRIQYDAPALQWVLVDSLIPMFGAAATFLGMLYVTARLSLPLAGVALIVSPIIVGLTKVYGGPLRRRWKQAKQLESGAMSIVQEVLSAVRVVKSFSREEREQGRFESQSSQSAAARVQVAFQEGCFGILVGLTTAAGTAAVMLVGAHQVRAGALTLGDLLLVMGYLVQLYEPLRTIGKNVGSQQKFIASAERAFMLLDEAPEVIEHKDALPLVRSRGAVSFDRVGFHYHPGHPVLHDITVDVPPGARVGISGRTGAGKTTLVNLLCRFYDPTCGSIRLDGIDLRRFKLRDLRQQFGIVLQDPVLFSAGIGENIAYARCGAGQEQIIEAAKAANAHEFISRLPEGYSTRVGERGMRLSGGERQRISLARAFLKDAPILILDEATSSVDVRTEAVMMEALTRLMRGRTTFMIAHRLGTLAGCDVRLELAGGTLVDLPPEMIPRPPAAHRVAVNA